MKRRLEGICGWMAVVVAMGCPGLAFGQGTQVDYDRARNLKKAFENKVYRDRVQPNWIEGGPQFWYRVQTGPETHEFILVDPEKGTRQPAFDHAKLATALAGVGLTNIRADRLPIDRLEFHLAEQTIDFRAGQKYWHGDLRTVELVAREAATVVSLSLAPLDEEPRASTRTGAETTLTFINHTAGPVRLFWLDSEGERQGYGDIPANGEHEQHTFAGHVWVLTDRANKTLAVFRAEERAATAEVPIDGSRPASPRPKFPRGSRARNAPRDRSPDGKWRTIVKDFNLIAHNEQSGDEFALTTDGRSGDEYSDRVFWSPDSRELVALRVEEGQEHKVYLVESSPKKQLQPVLQTIDYLKPGDKLPHPRLQLFDVAARKRIPVSDELFPNPFTETGRMEIRWAPDSSRFTFVYNQRGHQVLRVIGVDSHTGEARAIVEERSNTFIDYSGKQFAEYLDDSNEIIWMSERDGWNQLYLYDSKSGEVKNQITKGQWVVREVDRVNKEKRQVWFRAGGIRPGQDPYYVHFCRVNFDGSGLAILTEGDGTHSVEYSPDGRYFVDTFSRVDQAPVNELRRTDDGKLVCALERGDASELIKAGWRAPERFVAKARDGTTDIYGVIVRPTNFDPSRKYPVIENIYAGPQSSFVPKTFGPGNGMQELAELGFVVVQMDGMGTSNRSKKFHDVCWKNIGDAGFPDRILWIKAAGAKYPQLDLTRVGIYGTSAGGQNSLRALLAHGDFYRAAVSDCGCHDNRMDKIWWNEQWMGWPVGPHYDEQSNVTQAARLQGKLLLMVGELDRNVDPASTMQVVNALIKNDKDFEFVVVPGAGHGVAGTPYGHRRLEDFFVRSLLGVEPRS